VTCHGCAKPKNTSTLTRSILLKVRSRKSEEFGSVSSGVDWLDGTAPDLFVSLSDGETCYGDPTEGAVAQNRRIHQLTRSICSAIRIVERVLLMSR
jgi:hypothetical protein